MRYPPPKPLLLPAGTEEPWPDGTMVVYSYDKDEDPKLAYVTAGAKRGDSGEYSYVKNFIAEYQPGVFTGVGSGAYIRASERTGFHLPVTAEEALLARAYMADRTVQQAQEDLAAAEADRAAVQRVRQLVAQ